MAHKSTNGANYHDYEEDGSVVEDEQSTTKEDMFYSGVCGWLTISEFLKTSAWLGTIVDRSVDDIMAQE